MGVDLISENWETMETHMEKMKIYENLWENNHLENNGDLD